MAHNHSHGHEYFKPFVQNDDEHEHVFNLPGLNTVFLVGILLNIGIVVGEALTGFWLKSLALLTDAGHNLGDVAGLILAWAAYRMSAIKPTGRFTYGYQKTTILTALINAFILMATVAYILFSSINRLQHPQHINGIYISITAFIAIIFNALAAYMFIKDKNNDLNIKGAFLHMVSDAMVSAGVLVGGLIIYFTHWYIVDPIISIGISLVIVYSTWDLLTESLNLALDGVPRNIDVPHIKTLLQTIEGVTNVHHLHVWALGTMQNALTAHIVLDNRLTNEAVENIKQEIKHTLAHQNVQHATLETEFESNNCTSVVC